jgi:hypothetical protein
MRTDTVGRMLDNVRSFEVLSAKLYTTESGSMSSKEMISLRGKLITQQ